MLGDEDAKVATRGVLQKKQTTMEGRIRDNKEERNTNSEQKEEEKAQYYEISSEDEDCLDFLDNEVQLS